MYGEGFQDEDLTPFGGFVNGGEQLAQVLVLMEFEVVLASVVRDLQERGTCVGDNDGIAILKEALQKLEHVRVENHLW